MGVKRLLKPWITAEIRRMADYKHCLFKQQNINLIPFHTYNIYKNNLSRRIKLSKIITMLINLRIAIVI